MPAGLASPARSAMLQQFAPGRAASKPTTNARARRHDATLRKRAPTRSIDRDFTGLHRIYIVPRYSEFR
jgi:hypothetical protein